MCHRNHSYCHVNFTYQPSAPTRSSSIRNPHERIYIHTQQLVRQDHQEPKQQQPGDVAAKSAPAVAAPAAPAAHGVGSATVPGVPPAVAGDAAAKKKRGGRAKKKGGVAGAGDSAEAAGGEEGD